MYGTDPDELAEPIWVACQQACEKMLKAYLLLKGNRFRRTHDLAELAEQVGDTVPDIAGCLPDLIELSAGYIPSRYPFDSATVYGASDANQAVDITN